jgi:hypothetical protein
MTLSKTSVQPIDLDDLERQLREVAVSSLPQKNDDPLAELARIVGRDKAGLRSIAGGRSNAPEPAPYRAGAHEGQVSEVRPGASDADRSEFDLETSIKDALRADRSHDAVQDEADDQQDLAQDLAFDQAEGAPEDEAAQYSEEYEEQPYEDEGAYAEEGAVSRFDAVAQVPGIPGATAPRASTGRNFMSPRALALAVPLLFIAIGVGAAVLMRGGPIVRSGGDAPVIKADDAPVKIQPANAASGDQTPSQTALGAADASGKPSQVVLARPEQPVDVVAAVKSAQPGDSSVAQPPPSSGIVIVAGPGAASAPAASQPSAAAGGVAAAPASASPAASAPAPAPAAAPMPTAAANVPLPDLPQPAAQASVFGTPHRVSTVSVKPDGTIVSNGKPRVDAAPPVKPVTVASADATGSAAAPAATGSVTPAAKKPADTTRAKPTPIAADDQQAAKAAKPLIRPAKAKPADAPQVDHSADQAANAGAPMSITPQGRRGRTQLASATPAQSAATASDASSNAAGGSSFSVQLASSPSESEARATLSRLQKQFPSALGGGSVRRADLGGKGVYYRVRVGPLSRDAADKICSQLKAGGADCILTRG